MDTRETVRALQAITRAAQTMHNATGVPYSATVAATGQMITLNYADGSVRAAEVFRTGDGWRVRSWDGEQWRTLYTSNGHDGSNERVVHYWAMHMIHFIG